MTQRSETEMQEATMTLISDGEKAHTATLYKNPNGGWGGFVAEKTKDGADVHEILRKKSVTVHPTATVFRDAVDSIPQGATVGEYETLMNPEDVRHLSPPK